MIIGVDNGYTYTKNSKGEIFSSKVRTGEAIDISDVLNVESNGVKYVVGEKESNFTVDTNKINDEKTKINIITSIALSVNKPNEEVKLITGLPPGHYKNQKDKLRDMLLSKRNYSIKVNGENKSFILNEADVFIQGAGPVFAFPRYKYANVIVIDIGGLTVDVCYFENMKLIKYRTYSKGMLKFYSRIINEINSKLDLDLDIVQGEEILTEGIEIFGKQQDLSFLNTSINEYIDSFITNIKLDFPLRTTKEILTIGGGSEVLPLSNHIPNRKLLPNSQFINAYCYEEIGKVRFGV